MEVWGWVESGMDRLGRWGEWGAWGDTVSGDGAWIGVGAWAGYGLEFGWWQGRDGLILGLSTI